MAGRAYRYEMSWSATKATTPAAKTTISPTIIPDDYPTGIGKIDGRSADEAIALSRSASSNGVEPIGGIQCEPQVLQSRPACRTRALPAPTSVNETPRRDRFGLRPRLVPRRREPIARVPRTLRRRLDRHHAEIPLSADLQQRLGIAPIRRVGPLPRVHREHHGVEVPPAQSLEKSPRRLLVVSGDPGETSHSFVPHLQDLFRGTSPLFQHIEIRHRMHLVQIEVVGAEARQRLLGLRAHTLGIAPSGLARQEDLVANGRYQRTDQDLGVPVPRGDVQMVHPALQGLSETGCRLLRRGPRKTRSTQHGDRGLMLRPAEPAAFHAQMLRRSQPPPRPGTRLRSSVVR